MNTLLSDIATGLSNVLTRDNEAPMTEPLRLDDGSEALPGLQFADDTNTGIRRSGADVLELVTGGADRVQIDAAGKLWALFAFDVAGAANFQAAVTMLAGLTSRTTGGANEFIGQRYSADVNGPRLFFQKSRNAVLGSHTVVQDGDVLAHILADGSDGDSFERAADILALVDGTPGSADMPGAILFRTTADGAAAVTERMAIRADGRIQIPNRSAPLITFAAAGYADLAEISDPGAPAANNLRCRAVDVGGATKLLVENSAGVETILGPGELVAILEDQKAQNTAGGTFTAGADQTRVLNTSVYVRDSLVSLSSNQFTITTGTWEIEWSAPGHQCDQHQTFLYNVTDATEVARGSCAATNNTLSFSTHSSGSARVSIAASKAFEIRHRCTSTRATNGFGQATNLSTEVYTRVVVRRA